MITAPRLAMTCLALIVADPALAQSSPQVLAASCANCHGYEGRSPGAIPSLAGQDAETITRQMQGFKSGDIEATVMDRIAKGYTDDEIAALVEYFTQLEP